MWPGGLLWTPGSAPALLQSSASISSHPCTTLPLKLSLGLYAATTFTSLHVSGSLSLFSIPVHISMHLLHLLHPCSPTRLTMANPIHSLPSGLRACSAQFKPEWTSKALFSTLVPSWGGRGHGEHHPDMTSAQSCVWGFLSVGGLCAGAEAPWNSPAGSVLQDAEGPAWT